MDNAIVTGRGVEEPEVIHGATGLKVDAADPRAYAFAATRLLGDPEFMALFPNRGAEGVADP